VFSICVLGPAQVKITIGVPEIPSAPLGWSQPPGTGWRHVWPRPDA